MRSTQFKLALLGDKTMLVWLGKQYLGQADKQELTGRDGKDFGSGPPVINVMFMDGSDSKDS